MQVRDHDCLKTCLIELSAHKKKMSEGKDITLKPLFFSHGSNNKFSILSSVKWEYLNTALHEDWMVEKAVGMLRYFRCYLFWLYVYIYI